MESKKETTRKARSRESGRLGRPDMQFMLAQSSPSKEKKEYVNQGERGNSEKAGTPL